MGELTPLRVGRVDFINTFPLAWSLANRLAPGAFEETLAVPTRLNELLADGALDVANVSSIAYARNADDWVLLPSMCIASEGEVDSVNLVTDVPLPAISTIAVTSQSAASVALVQVLFPQAEILPEGATADATLLIGDEALRSSIDDPTPHHDLGALWFERTGLPMVFAVWAARRTVAAERLAELDHALAAAVADASEHAALVAEAAAERYGFPAGFLARYFEHLHYRFTDRKREGLRRYFDLAAEAGIIESAPALVFAGANHGAEA
ncbi:MAG: menaquinone biosynthetic enzyme MqnA/MqnD family protein [Gaiellales bacterium]